MTEHKPRTAFQDLRASVRHGRGAGARLAERLRRTAEAYRAGGPLARLTTDAKGVQDELFRRAEQVLHEIEEQGTRIASSIEEQTARLVARAVSRLNLATESGVGQLRVRVAECERRLGVRELEASLARDQQGGAAAEGERSS